MDDKLVHPNLLQTAELISLIKERQIVTENIDKLSRADLMDLFKKHIMPKPQRRLNPEIKIDTCITDTSDLTKEVKKIKLSRDLNQSSTPMDCSYKKNESELKRPTSDSDQSGNKKQRIQWP